MPFAFAQGYSTTKVSCK